MTDNGPYRDLIFHGNLVLPDCVLTGGELLVRDGRIAAINEQPQTPVAGTERIDVGDGFLTPGLIDLHVHGGAGADFMDGTTEAVCNVLAAHLRHGTTALLATTTAATHEQIMATLAACRAHCDERQLNDLARSWECGTPQRAFPTDFWTPRIVQGHLACARLLGVHLYGPYFRPEARGCHPGGPIRPPQRREFEEYLNAGVIATASVAPELPGAEQFVRACVEHGVHVGAGHTYATFAQMAEAVRWGVRHVDHLFCAMSDRARLRQDQNYPMRGGVLEATLYFDELTTEVIADGKHLAGELLQLARKIKGPDRLALVTDCNRALDLPDGEYLFGPLKGGEPFIRRDDVGLMPDGKALASSVRGMDHMLRSFIELTGCPVWEAVRMASLTPARIAGFDRDFGSLAVGKHADLVVFDRELQVQEVFIGGIQQEIAW